MVPEEPRNSGSPPSSSSCISYRWQVESHFYGLDLDEDRVWPDVFHGWMASSIVICGWVLKIIDWLNMSWTSDFWNRRQCKKESPNREGTQSFPCKNPESNLMPRMAQMNHHQLELEISISPSWSSREIVVCHTLRRNAFFFFLGGGGVVFLPKTWNDICKEHDRPSLNNNSKQNPSNPICHSWRIRSS